MNPWIPMVLWVIGAATAAPIVAEAPRTRVEIERISSTGRSIIVPAGESLQAALDGARGGDIIVLSAGAVYRGPFRLPRKTGDSWILIRTSAPHTMTFDDATRTIRIEDATKSRLEQAEAALRQAELQRTQLKENITLDVRRSALNVRRSLEKSSLAELAVSQATENLRVVADKYRSGLATSTDLLDAEVSLLQAQTQSSGAQVEFAVAQASLERALGGPERGVKKPE